MSFRSAQSLFVYWERCPPEHVATAMVLAAYTTWKPKEKAKPFRESTPDELRAFAAELGVAVTVKRSSSNG
jgi:hypothetical protein